MTRKEELEKARGLIGGFKNGILVTLSSDRALHGRPMRVAEIDESARISFVTALDSPKVNEIRQNSSVCVTFQDKNAYVAVYGEAQIESDPAEIEQVWSLLNEAWFNGPEDPSSVVLRVEPKIVEYWDQRGINGVKFVIEAVRSAVSGEPTRADDKQHATVDLR